MTLAAGTKLGPYEILSPLGAGGMGEVYRARDTRLDRSVAIKVLSSALAVTSELKARFEREARAISALNHPHICHLYDVGNENGADVLVMEFLEGESLSDRIRKGPLPLDQLLSGVHTVHTPTVRPHPARASAASAFDSSCHIIAVGPPPTFSGRTPAPTRVSAVGVPA